MKLRLLFLPLVLVACSVAPPAPLASSTLTRRSAAPGAPVVCRSGYLPDPACTPGALNPAVTQGNIAITVCKGGWTATIRPPVSESSRLKKEAAGMYGITDSLTGYEGDHLISLELGGAPDSIANLWDEPHVAVGSDGQSAGSYVKDAWENYLNFKVCRAHVRMTLAQAQQAIVGNWYANYVAAGRPADPYHYKH